MANNTRRLWAVLLGVTLGRVAFAYQLQTVASLTSTLLTQFGIAYATVGSLIGAYLLPGAFAALPLGLLGRRFGEERLLVAGLALMAAGNCIPAIAPGPALLAAGRVVAGTGAVALSVMLGKVLADLFSGSRFVAAMGLAVGGFPLGVGLCQVISPILLNGVGWAAVFMAGAAAAALAMALVLAGGIPARPIAGQGAFGWPSRRECGLVFVAGLVFTFYNCGYFGFLSYVPALLQDRGVGHLQVGWAMTLATWLNIPSILVGGLLTARIGVLAVFLIGATVLSVTVAGIAVSQDWLLWCVLFGTISALHPGVIVAAGTLSARPQNRAVGMAIFYTTYYIGGAVFPAICGAAADRFGTPAAALLTASGFSLLSLPLFVLHQRLLRVHDPCMADAAD